LNQCGEMAEWSNAPDSKLGSVLKAFSALHQCMPANERFLAIIRRPTCSKIAGKKLCSLSLIGVRCACHRTGSNAMQGRSTATRESHPNSAWKAAPLLAFWDLCSQETPTQTPRTLRYKPFLTRCRRST